MSLASATNVIPIQLFELVSDILSNHSTGGVTTLFRNNDCPNQWKWGLGPDIRICLASQELRHAVRQSFMALLKLVCKFFFHQHV
jgi:hypothetical protein